MHKNLASIELLALSNSDLERAIEYLVRSMEGKSLERDANDQSEPELRDMPLFGAVPAGSPCDNPQLAESFVKIPIDKYPKDAFALRVRGESMIGRNINDGDVVIVQKGEAKNGDAVVALIDGERRSKRWSTATASASCAARIRSTGIRCSPTSLPSKRS